MTSEKIYNEILLQWSQNTDWCKPKAEFEPDLIFRNPLCGDEITLNITLTDGIIERFTYSIRGCILSKAACAFLASMAAGMSNEQVLVQRASLHTFLASRPAYQTDSPPLFDFFSPIRAHKSRYSCVLLPYDAIIEYIARENQ